jgi:hypothetical protein
VASRISISCDAAAGIEVHAEALLTMVYKGHGRREASLAGMAYFRQKYGIWSICTLMP